MQSDNVQVKNYQKKLDSDLEEKEEFMYNEADSESDSESESEQKIQFSIPQKSSRRTSKHFETDLLNRLSDLQGQYVGLTQKLCKAKSDRVKAESKERYTILEMNNLNVDLYKYKDYYNMTLVKVRKYEAIMFVYVLVQILKVFFGLSWI